MATPVKTQKPIASARKASQLSAVKEVEELKVKSTSIFNTQELATISEAQNFSAAEESGESDHEDVKGDVVSSAVATAQITSGGKGFVKKRRYTGYVPTRTVPSCCSAVFRREGGVTKVRLPWGSGTSTRFSTNIGFNRFDLKPLLAELAQSASGISNSHIFDLQGGIKIEAVVALKFTTPSGTGYMDQGMFQNYSSYCAAVEQDALAELNNAE
jgi:hypothetical protein